jgi:amidase
LARLTTGSASRPLFPNRSSGEWLVTRDVYGNPLYQRMTPKLESGKLSGVFAGDKLEGTLSGNALHFVARDEQNNTSEFTGVFNGTTITGKVVETNASDPDDKAENEMSATRPPEGPAGPRKRNEFTPTIFYRQFSASNKPVPRPTVMM